MTGKPLYLHGHQPLAVALDGPALRVTQAESADRLFPLERLSRVVASGEVAWSTEALLACADHGVPVSFLAARSSSLLTADGERQPSL